MLTVLWAAKTIIDPMKIVKNILKWASGFLLLIVLLEMGQWLYIRGKIKHLSGQNTTLVDASKLETGFDKLAIQNGNVLAHDAASMLLNHTVLIRDNRIEAVGDTLNIPQDYEVTDDGKRFLIPGLRDIHIHPYRSNNRPRMALSATSVPTLHC